VIHGYIDNVLEILVSKLNLSIPQFKLERWVKVAIQESKTGKETLRVTGMDALGGPFDLFKAVKVDGTPGAQRQLKES